MIAPGTRALQAATFQGLGDLGGGRSVAASVSADGSTVVGDSLVAGAGSPTSRTHAFIWTGSGPIQDLGFFTDGTGAFQALDVSGDGSVVVGRGSLTKGGREAFSWSRSFTRLGDLPGGGVNPFGNAVAISDDGRVIVGQGSSSSGLLPAIWTGGATTPTALSVPAGTTGGSLTGISGDGTIAGGWLTEPTGVRAQLWTPGGGFVSLGTLHSDNTGASRTDGVSQDGKVLVGQSDSDAGQQAIMWTSGEGMVGLGDLGGGPFESWAKAVNADGSVIVGYGTTGIVNDNHVREAFIWDAKRGMRNLKDVLTDLGLNMDGWRLEEATGVSADGNVIVGYGVNAKGLTEGFVATLVPEPGTAAMFMTACGLGLMRRPRKLNRL